jgi:hypothetical protein
MPAFFVGYLLKQKTIHRYIPIQTCLYFSTTRLTPLVAGEHSSWRNPTPVPKTADTWPFASKTTDIARLSPTSYCQSSCGEGVPSRLGEWLGLPSKASTSALPQDWRSKTSTASLTSFVLGPGKVNRFETKRLTFSFSSARSFTTVFDSVAIVGWLVEFVVWAFVQCGARQQATTIAWTACEKSFMMMFTLVMVCRKLQ